MREGPGKDGQKRFSFKGNNSLRAIRSGPQRQQACLSLKNNGMPFSKRTAAEFP